MAKAAGFQIYATVSGVPGTWGKISGGQPSVPTSKVSDGGAPEETLYGKRTYADLTVARPFDTARDPAVERTLNGQLRRVFTVTKLETDPDGIVVNTVTYTCGLKEVQPPEGDASGSGEVMLSLVFSVDGVL